jgi:uncharacterized protein (TIGR03437 family)
MCYGEKGFEVRKLSIYVAAVCACVRLAAQTAATFGTPIPAPGNLQDIVLDEGRGKLYLVDNAGNQVEVYSIPDQKFLPPIAVGQQPVSAAMSPDGRFLFVTNFGSSTLSVVDLNAAGTVNTISLPAPPEGVAVGFDGRVLITTIGTGSAATPVNTLLVFDPSQVPGSPAQLTPVTAPPPAPQSPLLPGFIAARPFLTFRGRLQATPDGQLIIGMNTPTGNSTIVFVYEAASAAVLQARLTPGLSTVMSVSPDGSRFMSGLRLFETRTLNMLAQTNASNANFPIPAAFNLQQNVGGSVFSPDGGTLYSAFNVAPFALPQPRPNSSILLVSNPRNLGIRLGLRLPENILGKMVISSDGNTVYALSDSGILMLPVGRIFDYPIIMPETTAVRLSANPCNRGLVTAQVKINNLGKGKLTFTFPQPAGVGGAPPALLAQAVSGVAPSSIRLTLNPRLTGVQPGTTVTALQLSSNDAINIPPLIRVYQNTETTGQVGITIPIEGSIAGAAGLTDLQVDNLRGRLYIANAGLNRIEVYDFRNRKMLPPMEAGQLPQSMAMTSDGAQLYVANAGGEWISIIDLDLQQQVGKVDFPPNPFNFNSAPITPASIAMGIFGLQFVGSNGSVWSVRGNTAAPRPADAVLSTNGLAAVAAPARMVATPGNESIILLGNTGIAYRYDAMTDTWTNAATVFATPPPIDNYYGPLSAGPGGSYYLANGAVLNSTLAFVAGRNTAAGAGGNVGQGIRLQPAVAAIDEKTYARFTVPPQTNAASAPVGDPRPLVEVVDVKTQARLLTVAAPEGPAIPLFGNGRANVNPRLMAVDGAGANAFLLTMSGLSVVALQQADARKKPAINPNGVVNGANFSSSISPGALISIFGANLADQAAAASDLPLPTVLGGSCVTFNDVTLPLLSVSPAQINAQLPATAVPGATAVVVRSLMTGLQSDTTLVNVSRSSPGVFALSGNQAALFHGGDMTPVTRSNPARRDEILVLFGTGLPASGGQQLDVGAPAPASPLITSDTPQVFLGNPDAPGTEMQVLWSGFTPGFIGLNQVNFHVPVNAATGDNLPVVLRVDGAESPRSGPLAPVTSLR